MKKLALFLSILLAITSSVNTNVFADELSENATETSVSADTVSEDIISSDNTLLSYSDYIANQDCCQATISDNTISNSNISENNTTDTISFDCVPDESSNNGSKKNNNTISEITVLPSPRGLSSTYAEEPAGITSQDDLQKAAALAEKADMIIDQMYDSLGSPTDYEKAHYLHDWLVTHMSYGNNDESFAWAYEGIINNVGVCADYTAAYEYLLSKVNIPSVMVTSYSLDHAWNLVTIDNKNYYVDCTWEDKQYFTYPGLRGFDSGHHHLLCDRDKCHDEFTYNSDRMSGHTSEDWMYLDKTTERTINAYTSTPTSSDYNDHVWLNCCYPFDDSIFNTTYTKGTTAISFNGYNVISTYKGVYLLKNYYDDEPIDSVILNDSTRYIHDISADGTTVTYTTWLKSNPVASTAETHTIDWSNYFSGTVGTGVTWKYLNGTLTISGNGAMDDYKPYQPWEDFSSLIRRIDISDTVSYITLYPAYETNLEAIYFGGTKSQWNARAKYINGTVLSSKTVYFLKHEVIFKDINGSTTDTQIISDNRTASYVIPATVANYNFDCWCKDSALTIPYDFAAPVTDDLTLYPKYNPVNCTVNFNTNGGSSVNPVTVAYNTPISKPADPTKSNCTFKGWYTDSACTNAYNFSNPVKSSFTLYAKFEQNSSDPTPPPTPPSPDPAPPSPDPAATNPEDGKKDPNAPATDGRTEQKDTVTAGQKLDVRSLYFSDVPNIAKYRTVLAGTNSNASSYATVSTKGILTVKKAAKITIIPMRKEGKSYVDIEGASATLTVLAAPKLKFTKPLSYVGQKISVYDYISKEWSESGMKALAFESSKSDIADIDDSGIITAGTKGGSSKITVYFSKANENGATNTLKCAANISVKVPTYAKSEYKLQTGQKTAVTIKNVTKDSGIKWAVSSDKIARLETTNTAGKVNITGLNAGETELNAVIDGKTYTCKISVTPPEIKKSSLSVKVGKKATIGLKNTKIKAADVKWTSEDTSIARVDSGGKVSGVKAGTTTIWTESGGVRNECSVTVE